MNQADMITKIGAGKGFVAALDQSGGSTPKALRAYGVSDDTWSGDEEMFAEIHKMRSRIITAPAFASGKVLGAILFERTMDGMVQGQPTPDALKERGVVPFIKVDQGLEDEADGVQMMKPLDKLDALLDKSVKAGMFGTKMRSVIKSANPGGIVSIVDQQFAVGEQIIERGLMPMLEPEYDITAADREQGEQLLRDAILAKLDMLPDGQMVMLKLSLPVDPNLYLPLVEHPSVLRVVALSGGFDRDEACAELAKNNGVIASFSRALLEGLHADMSDDEFNARLQQSIDEIAAASAT